MKFYIYCYKSHEKKLIDNYIFLRKWIGNVARSMCKENKTFLFGYEVEIGKILIF